MAKIPFFITFHQDALIGWQTEYDQNHGVRNHLTKFLQARICGFAAVVTVQSPTVKEITKHVLGLNGKVRVVVLPNTVDVARFSIDDSPPPQNRNLLFVGNLIKRKGIDVLMRSVAVLVESFPDTRLTIVGIGPEKDSLQALASELLVSNSVSFLGEVDDIALKSQYHSAAAVILPSYSEVFGVVILEALAASRPVIATATVGAMSIISDCVTGRVVPIGSSKGVANAIADLFSDDKSATEMAKAGHQLVLAKYALEAVSKDLESLYRSVVSCPENLVE